MAKLGPDELTRRLKRGLKECGNTHSMEDIQQAVNEGRVQSWVNRDSLVLTEVLTYPQDKALNVILVLGVLDDVMEMQPALDQWAREQGCTRMFTTGRHGLSKVLPAYGWKMSKKIIFERSL